jgi:TonB family protein
MCSLIVAAIVSAGSPPVALGQAGSAGSEPVVIRRVEPNYPSAAKRDKLQGSVDLQVVVLANGTVGDVRVVKSLDRITGLDDEAVNAARKWLFRPAMKDGQPVEKTVTLVMDFRMTAAPEVATGVARNDPFAQGVRRLDDAGLVVPRASLHRTPGLVNAARRAESPVLAVAVDFVILADGTVARARVARGPDAPTGVTDDAVWAVVRDWRFSPAELDRRPVPVLVRAYVAVPRQEDP